MTMPPTKGWTCTFCGQLNAEWATDCGRCQSPQDRGQTAPPTKEPRRWTFREGGCALPAPCLPCIDGKEHEPVEIVEVVDAAAYDALAARLEREAWCYSQNVDTLAAKLAQAERERDEMSAAWDRLSDKMVEMQETEARLTRELEEAKAEQETWHRVANEMREEKLRLYDQNAALREVVEAAKRCVTCVAYEDRRQARTDLLAALANMECPDPSTNRVEGEDG